MTEKVMLTVEVPATGTCERMMVPLSMPVSQGVRLMLRLLDIPGQEPPLRVFSTLGGVFLQRERTFADNGVQQGDRLLLL
jgi:hypothetical protein